MTSRIWSCVAVVAACFWGCGTQVSPQEHVGKAESELYAQGAPCTSSSQCGSAAPFCVDGVCCNTACGGGARDTQTCSNVYGTVIHNGVPVVTNGTCYTGLVTGDPCGLLNTVDPCTWRGTTVNGGGQCPNPNNSSFACFPCTSDAQCSGAYPFCSIPPGASTGACVTCNGNYLSNATHPCGQSAPVCTSTGACGQCNGNYLSGATFPCSAANPICQLATGQCVPGCNADYGALASPGVFPCTQAALPICNAATGECGPGCNGDLGDASATAPCTAPSTPVCASGRCVQCTPATPGQCQGSSPTCDAATNTCAPCAADYSTTPPPSLACPNPLFPACVGGLCLQCAGSNGAACSTLGQVCNATTNTCVQCTANAQCSSLTTTPVCDLSADSTTNTCVQCAGDNGTGPLGCPSPSAPACLATGACGQCSATDLTLCSGTAPTCDTQSATCAPCTGDNGTSTARPCPTTANPFCITSGPQTGACGKCTSNSDCAGDPAGSLCNTNAGACGPFCTNDSDCSSAQWCALGVCVAKTPNGQPIPVISGATNGTCTAPVGARVCVSGVCDTTDNLCGLLNGGTCGPPPQNAECRTGFCDPGTNTCGQPTGGPCTSNGDCRSGICSPGGSCGGCQADSDCGGATSGHVCDDVSKVCKSGCRGSGGNGCPTGELCSSVNATVGSCSTPADAGAPDSGVIDSGGVDSGSGDAGADGQVDAGAVDSGFGNDAAGTDDSGSESDAMVDATGSGSGAPTSDSGTALGALPDDTGVVAGGGCSCNDAGAPTTSSNGGWMALVGIVGFAQLTRSRRRAK